jgi:RNA polymerase sigma-70 factor, ECF subfamily
VGARDPIGGEQATILLDLYEPALPQVYGYVLARCGGHVATAEELTAETFMAAVAAVNHRTVERVSIAWLMGVARHKLIDHWRRQAIDERSLRLVHSAQPDALDEWDVRLDVMRAHDVLARLGAQHRAALTLRYLDGLSVPEVADVLGRTVHATEALLVRARVAFRAVYAEGDDDA